MQPFDQEHVAEYIRKRNLAQEPHIPFYVKWVKRFLAAPSRQQRPRRMIVLSFLQTSSIRINRSRSGNAARPSRPLNFT